VEPKAPFTQCLAFSADGGLSWEKFAHNPIVPLIGKGTRDPKVIWHPDSRQWIMALYVGAHPEQEQHHHFALYASLNLKQWDHLQDLYFPGSGECPDFFPLPLDGDADNLRWVYWTSDGYYQVGDFDGKRFSAEAALVKSTYSVVKHDKSKALQFKGGYAAQTWSDIPAEDGRRIQIAWLTGDIPGMPFNQQMTFPVELTLRSSLEGPRLHSWPVDEIKQLHSETSDRQNIELANSPYFLPTDGHDLLDVQFMLDVGNAREIELNFRGIPVVIDMKQRQVNCQEESVRLEAYDGQIHIRVLLDRASIEIFAQDGLVYLPLCVIPAEGDTTCFLRAQGGSALAKSILIHKLSSSWA
jgi:sucrose-6-phosphate hydrolase SacC (GH32 family)